MASTFQMPWRDASDERSSAVFPVNDAVLDATLTALYNAVVAITLDGRQQALLKQSIGKDGANGPKATTNLSQRENKFICTYTDSAGDIHTLEIPCVDLTELSSDGSTIDLSAGNGLAFKTAFEAAVRVDNTLTVTLDEVKFVGRNL